MSTNEITDKIAVVSVDIGFFGAYRRATEEDIKALGGVVPDSNVLTKGSKRIFPNYDELLRDEQTARGVANPDTFGSVKKDVDRFLWKRGTRLVGKGGWVISMDVVDEVLEKLKSGSIIVDSLKSTLEANYDAWLEGHIQANSKEEAIIRQSARPCAEAIAKFRFQWDVYKIVPLGAKGGSDLESMATGLTAQLFTEVSVAAKAAMEKSFKGKEKVGQKAMHQIQACGDKMRHLHFLDPKVEGAIQMMTHVLGSLPQTGYIENTPGNDCFSRLHRLVDLMTIPTKFEEAGKRIADGETADDVLRPQASINQVLDLTGDLFIPPQSVQIQDAPEPEKAVAAEEATEAEGEFEPEALFF